MATEREIGAALVRLRDALGKQPPPNSMPEWEQQLWPYDMDTLNFAVSAYLAAGEPWFPSPGKIRELCEANQPEAELIFKPYQYMLAMPYEHTPEELDDMARVCIAAGRDCSATALRKRAEFMRTGEQPPGLMEELRKLFEEGFAP
jgi:hypothetical protein